MLLAQCQVLVTHEQKLTELASVQRSQGHKLDAVFDAILEDRQARVKSIIPAELSDETPPEMSARDKCVRLVNTIARATEKPHARVWVEACELMYHHYSVNVQQRAKNAGMCTGRDKQKQRGLEKSFLRAALRLFCGGRVDKDENVEYTKLVGMSH